MQHARTSRRQVGVLLALWHSSTHFNGWRWGASAHVSSNRLLVLVSSANYDKQKWGGGNCGVTSCSLHRSTWAQLGMTSVSMASCQVGRAWLSNVKTSCQVSCNLCQLGATWQQSWCHMSKFLLLGSCFVSSVDWEGWRGSPGYMAKGRVTLI